MDEISAGVLTLNRRLKTMVRAVSGREKTRALMQGGLLVERYGKLNIREAELIDTRNLTNAVSAEPDGPDAVTIGPRNVVYAAIHEFGGTITAKVAKYLSIPVSDAARGAGSPRNFPGKLHGIVIDAGSQMVLKDEDGFIHYVLKRSVYIPARPYMRPALDEHTPEVTKAIGDDLRRTIYGAARS